MASFPALRSGGLGTFQGRVRRDALANVPSRSSLFPGNGGAARGAAPDGARLRLQERAGTALRLSLLDAGPVVKKSVARLAGARRPGRGRGGR